MKLTALIPAYNDAYTLGLCLASIVAHFDEVLVLDDASTDDTPDVAADFARRHAHLRYFRHEGPQLGWVLARNRLLERTDADHLFWLDSDDVLCEYNAGVLREIAGGKQPLVRLQLCEIWGDLCHTTQRLRHYDRCHVFVNRRLFKDFAWRGRAAAKPSSLDIGHSVIARNGPGPLFFHLKGVKPDRRLVERAHMRAWLRAERRTDRLSDFRGPRRKPDALVGARHAQESSVGARHAVPEEDIHARALHILLRSRQDHLTPTYVPPVARRAPRRPEVIEAALPGRFRIVYKDGHPVDRTDRMMAS